MTALRGRCAVTTSSAATLECAVAVVGITLLWNDAVCVDCPSSVDSVLRGKIRSDDARVTLVGLNGAFGDDDGVAENPSSGGGAPLLLLSNFEAKSFTDCERPTGLPTPSFFCCCCGCGAPSAECRFGAGAGVTGSLNISLLLTDGGSDVTARRLMRGDCAPDVVDFLASMTFRRNSGEPNGDENGDDVTLLSVFVNGACLPFGNWLIFTAGSLS